MNIIFPPIPGPTGATGSRGPAGADGSNGTNGNPGAPGTNGTNGDPGTPGALNILHVGLGIYNPDTFATAIAAAVNPGVDNPYLILRHPPSSEALPASPGTGITCAAVVGDEVPSTVGVMRTLYEGTVEITTPATPGLWGDATPVDLTIPAGWMSKLIVTSGVADSSEQGTPTIMYGVGRTAHTVPYVYGITSDEADALLSTGILAGAHVLGDSSGDYSAGEYWTVNGISRFVATEEHLYLNVVARSTVANDTISIAFVVTAKVELVPQPVEAPS